MASLFLSDNAAYELLLSYLSPADHASLRLVSRSWQALVDRSLGCLYPLSVTPLNFGFSNVPCLVYKSLFQSNSVRQHHALQTGPCHGFLAIARQFTALHTLAVDCISRGCGDFGSLQLLQQLRRLKLNQFSFSDEAFEAGIAHCSGLQVLHLECHQAMLQVRSLRHLSGLLQLQELCLKPRGYINVPPESSSGIAALGHLTRLTRLELVTALKPSRCPVAGDVGGLPGPLPDLSGLPAGRPVYFDVAATLHLSASLARLRTMQVLRVSGVTSLPAAVSCLSQLRELSVERVGTVSCTAVASLRHLKQLTALTLITAADLADTNPRLQQQQLQHYLQHQQQQQEGQVHLAPPWDAMLPAAAAAAVGVGAAAGPFAGGGLQGLGFEGHPQNPNAAAAALEGLSSRDGFWVMLLLLPNLQELVVGCVCRGQTLNLTTTLTHNLEPPAYINPGLNNPNPAHPAAARGQGIVATALAAAEPWHQQLQQQQAGFGGLEGQRHRGRHGKVVGQQDGTHRDWLLQGVGGQRYEQQEGAAVSAYVCPNKWSELADMQGLHHVVIEARGWHSAAITARYPSVADAVTSLMGWHCVGPSPAAAAAAAAAAASGGSGAGAAGTAQRGGLLGKVAHMVELGSRSSNSAGSSDASGSSSNNSQGPAMAAAAAGAASSSVLSNHENSSRSSSRSQANDVIPLTDTFLSKRTHPGSTKTVHDNTNTSSTHNTTNVKVIGAKTAGSTAGISAAAAAAAGCAAAPLLSAGAVGVFKNHPGQEGYLPSVPQLLVLALRPGMGAMGLLQQQLVRHHLMQLQQQQGVAGGQLVQGAGGAVPLPESPARRLLLAQLRASMHPSKLMVVLAASGTAITRLELTVDQSWPPLVLSGLGQLQRLRQLAVLKLDCGRQDPPPEMWAGLSGLTSLRWLCLRWLEALPVSCLAPLTGLVALQLKAITAPPGAAELAEVLAGMPHLSALAIEGGLLDVEGDWLRDTAGLLRHGRWTSSWVEHTLCRQQRLRVLGSITAALLMAVALNSPKWPEMIVTAILAAAAGAIFVLAVASSLLSLMLDHHNHHQQPGCQAGVQAGVLRGPDSSLTGQAEVLAAAGAAADLTGSAASTAAACRGQPGSSSSGGINDRWISGLFQQGGLGWWLGGWLVWCMRAYYKVAASLWRWLVAAPVSSIARSSSSSGSSPAGTGHSSSGSSSSSASQVPQLVTNLSSSRSPAAVPAAAAAPDVSNPTMQARPAGVVVDPGAAFRRLRYLSLRRCTLTCRGSSLSNRMWQLTSLTSHLGPGFRSQAVAVLLGLLLWPLAAGGALSRIVASSSYQAAVGGSAGGWSVLWGGSGGGGGAGGAAGAGTGRGFGGSSSNRGRGKFAGWGWYWDELCGLLQAAANRVEVATVGRGSALVGLASEMPDLRFLDVTWLNLEPWELHGLLQLQQLHYLGLGKQQLGVVMSQEAQLARSCRRGGSSSRRRMAVRAAAAAARRASGGASRAGAGGAGGFVFKGGAFGFWSWLLLSPFWCAGVMLRWCWSGLWGVLFGSWLVPLGFAGGAAGFGGWGGGGAAAAAAAGVGSGVVGYDLFDDDVGWLDDVGPDVVLVEAPAGFDEVIEREIMGAAPAAAV